MRKLLLSTLFVLLLTVSAASAQTLYGIAFQGNAAPSTLYTVDPSTGAAVAVGPIGFERCSGADFDAAGTLFATCERADGSDTPVLVTIDPMTGAGTEIGPTGLTGAVTDISFRADGTLFAYDATNAPNHTLHTIDTATGMSTLVGDTGLSLAGGNGMTFDLEGVLYHSQFTGGPNTALNTIDPATAVVTPVGQVPPVIGRFNALEVDPQTGTIYGVVNDGAGGGGPNTLATIDTTIVAATLIGATENGLTALAFEPLPLPPSPIEIPTLGEYGLMALVLLLAGFGFYFMRRR
ncbi:MAG: IPTL-CTERM sorting domain-containing protein [Acidobacteriota bacterium]